MTCSKKHSARSRKSIAGHGGQSQTRKPSRKGKASERKQRGRMDVSRREYEGR